MKTLDIGYINKNNQKNLGYKGKSETHYNQNFYEMELGEELDRLVPYIAHCFRVFDIQELSDNLDVKTFCKVREQMDMPLGDKVAYTTRFLGDYEADAEELVILNEVFRGQNQSAVAALIRTNRHRWIDLSLLQ